MDDRCLQLMFSFQIGAHFIRIAPLVSHYEENGLFPRKFEVTLELPKDLHAGIDLELVLLNIVLFSGSGACSISPILGRLTTWSRLAAANG
jgi:hypothetical protein